MKKIYLPLIAMLLAFSTLVTLSSSCNEKHETEMGEGEEEKDEYDKPNEAAEFEKQRNMDPNTGTVSFRNMWDAVMETEERKNTVNYTEALSPLAWIERGSNSDAVGPSNGNTRGPGNAVTSGRMRTVWVDLGDPTGKTVWVGGISGGIWKTNDVTATTPTWTNANDYLSNLAVSGICQDPTNTNTMYFCTGESYFTGGGVRGVGVFKSIDHGVTWNFLANTSTFVSCTKILCDAAGNVYVSTLGVSPDLALMRSTNAGASWVNINPFAAVGVTQTSRIPDFEISSTGRMHVIGGFSSASATLGGYRFTDNPTAATVVWQSATTMFTWPFGTDARTELETVGNIIYASLGQAAVAPAGGKIEKVAKSIDGGANWITTDLTSFNISELNGGGQGGYSQGLTVDPSDPNIVIVGSLKLLKSTDGGLTFNTASQWVGTAGPYVHADIHNMVWYDNGNKLLVGTDGGLFYSTNKGANYTDKNTGLRLKQFYGVTIHPTSTNYFLAGAQDNGTHQFNGPGLTSSIEVLGGDGGYTAIDQNEPQFQTGAYVFANFRRSANGGATWSSSGSASTAGLFINPYDYDNTQNKVYASFSAGQFLRWENPQAGFNFVPVSIPAFGTALVASATVSPYTPNRVFFGLTNGKVFQIDNADQATPTAIDITPAGIAAGFVNNVSIGISDQNITVTLSSAFAAATPNIWTTTNAGTSWTAIDGNLPEMPVYWSLYHPDGDTKMYIATEAGIWSTDAIAGAATIWTAESGFPTAKTTMLKYRASDRTIAASTYGRGLWTSTIPNTNCTAATITTQPVNVSICAGLNTSFSIVSSGSAPLTYQWELSTTGAGGPWAALANNATYSNVTTNTLNITGATTALNTYQYRCVVSNCAAINATSNAGILTVNAVPAAPTVTATVTYCQGQTATALTATGAGLLWYTTATGGTGSATAPTPSTVLVATTNYYVSQTTGTCESPRALIAVTVNITPAAPTVVSPINYCQNAPAVALTATGTNLKWYTVPSGGAGSTTAPTPITTALGTVTYYVSQTTGICEGPRAAIAVNTTAVPAAPTVTSPITYCQGVAAVALTATGSNLLWYTAATGGTGSATAPVPSTATVGPITYYVSQTTGCESPRAAIVVTVIAGTVAPTVTSPVTYCQGATSVPLTATGTSLLWYTTATGGVGSATAPTPSTATAGTTIFYVTQTLGTCESPRAAITVTVNATPAAPTVTSPINYCQNASSAALTATGTNLLWYTGPTGGAGSTTAPTPLTTALGTIIYYVSQTSAIGSCEGPRAAITVNVLAVSPAPIVTSPVTYCQNATAVPLTAMGTNLLWYTAPLGGTGSTTAPTPSTATAGSTIYYVTQNSTCGESVRAAITVTVNPTPAAPTVTTSTFTYCQGATASTLSATGTNLLWYTVATGGTGSSTAPTPSTATAGITNYYVSQSALTCESPRTLIAVTVIATPAAPIVTTPINYCQNVVAVPLTATGTNLKWYTVPTGGVGSATAPTPITTALGTTTYYVSQSTAVGSCEGPRAAINVIVAAVSPAPTVTSPVTYCQNATAVPLTATGTNLLWYTTATGGTGSATAPTPSTAAPGNTIYYVTQNSTCGESLRTPLTVVVNATPAAPTTTAAFSYCQGATAAVLTATGSNLLWYTVATGGTGSATAPTPSTATAGVTNYYVSQSILGCESPRTLIAVTVIALPALPTVTSPVTYCIGATAAPLTATGTGLKWYTVPTGGTSSATAPTPLTTAIGTTTYYVSQTSGTCESGRAAIVVNVTAVTAAPTVTTPIIYCQGATANALVATGTNLLWYTSATGGTGSATAPTISTTTTGTITYYVSQTGNCESPRAAIVVTVNPTPTAPAANAAISYCQGSPTTALTATGTNLLWYTVATGGTGSATAPTPSTAAAGTTTYYVSQTTGVCEGPRTAITVTVTSAPSITAQPQDITSCATSATFSVSASGTGLTYQWFVSIDGGVTYLPIAGATANVVTLTGLTPAQSNNKYRCVVSSGTCTAATSNGVSAKVGTNPVVVLTAAPSANFNPYTNGGLYVTVSPTGNYTYKWNRNTSLLTNTGSSITKANGLLDEFGAYQVTVTDVATGCIGLSNTVSVADAPTKNEQLFVAPNPTTGIVTLSYFNNSTTAQLYKVQVYDRKGTRVRSESVTLAGRYGSTTINLSTLATGSYIITLRDNAGKKLASQSILKY
jgi:Ig-like domain CHU_C associated/Secretion system C-terminal sorting domain